MITYEKHEKIFLDLFENYHVLISCDSFPKKICYYNKYGKKLLEYNEYGNVWIDYHRIYVVLQNYFESNFESETMLIYGYIKLKCTEILIKHFKLNMENNAIMVDLDNDSTIFESDVIDHLLK